VAIIQYSEEEEAGRYCLTGELKTDVLVFVGVVLLLLLFYLHCVKVLFPVTDLTPNYQPNLLTIWRKLFV